MHLCVNQVLAMGNSVGVRSVGVGLSSDNVLNVLWLVRDSWRHRYLDNNKLNGPIPETMGELRMLKDL